MKKLTVVALILTAFLCLSSTGNIALDANEIVKRSEQNVKRSNVVADIKISLIRPKWTKTYELKTWTKGESLAMAYIKSPAKDKGTVFLKTESEVYNYIPRINKVVKMPMNLLGQKWMGSDMTMDDLVKGSKLSADYSARLTGEEFVSDRSCFKLELTPADELSSLWSKVELWVDKVHFLQMKILFYDEDGDVAHSIKGKGLKKFDDIYSVAVYEVIPANKPGHKTRIETQWLDYSQILSPSLFTKENMKKLKP